MTCPGCGRVNLADSTFCSACGSPLERACAKCGRKLAVDAAFCDRCGSRVVEPSPAPSALILRLLAEDPAERPESASDVLTALEGVDLSARVEEPSKDGDDANVLDSLAGGVFVGRQREMGELKAALEDALSGRGRLVTLVGEPGIGKTRTARELATYAGLRGAQVLWGRCYEEQGVPSYWPWVQAIRSYVREREPEQLRSEMGAGAADIAEIVSDVRERLPDLEQPPAQESPEQARCRLFDSITTFLKSASDSRPLVLMLDDLHWADKPSLLLLEFVAGELAGARLLLIGTYRDMELSRQHPLAETLGELTRERLFQRILLRGLTQEDVSRFIEATSGITPPQGLVESVYQQTEGNPLFVTEVVLHAQIAQTLEELYGEEAEAHAAELAHHLAQAETVLGSEKLVRYSRLAGERALTVYGYEEALGHFQRALAAKGDGVESQRAADAETAAILFGIGQAPSWPRSRCTSGAIPQRTCTVPSISTPSPGTWPGRWPSPPISPLHPRRAPGGGHRADFPRAEAGDGRLSRGSVSPIAVRGGAGDSSGRL